MRIVRRKEDMSPNGRLCLTEQDDGDVVIIITNDDGYSVSVEFCTIFGGGGGSPNTFNALKNLFDAMEKDNLENRNSRAVD